MLKEIIGEAIAYDKFHDKVDVLIVVYAFVYFHYIWMVQRHHDADFAAEEVLHIALVDFGVFVFV